MTLLYRGPTSKEHSGDVTAAEVTLRCTVLVATDARDDRLAAQTWAYLMFIIGERLSRPWGSWPLHRVPRFRSSLAA
jgi:hypothetical protein